MRFRTHKGSVILLYLCVLILYFYMYFILSVTSLCVYSSFYVLCHPISCYTFNSIYYIYMLLYVFYTSACTTYPYVNVNQPGITQCFFVFLSFTTWFYAMFIPIFCTGFQLPTLDPVLLVLTVNGEAQKMCIRCYIMLPYTWFRAPSVLCTDITLCILFPT